MKLTVNDNSTVGLSVSEDDVSLRSGDTINIGTSDYEELQNKPSINDVELVGDLDSDDLGLADANHTHAKADVTDFAHTHTKSDVTDFAHTHTKSQITDFPVLATVATSGKYSDLTGKPNIPTKTSDLINDKNYYGVTNIGYVDIGDYDDDIEEYMCQELRANGFYTFYTDEFAYWVQGEVLEGDTGPVIQYTYWSTEEGGISVYLLSAWLDEDGEVVSTRSSNVLSSALASALYATIGHVHYRYGNGNMDAFDYCDTISQENDKPMLYKDNDTDDWSIIETWITTNGIYFQRVTLLYDTSAIYQRSGYRSGNTKVWNAWEEIKPSADEQVKQQYQAESGYSYWRPLLVGKSAGSSEGFTPSTVTDQTYAFKTLECQPSTGTIRMGVASMFKGSYESKISPDTLTADRTITIPDKSGTLALTSDITGGGMSITVNGTDYPITAITLTTISGVEGVLVEYDDGNNGQLFFADGVGLAAVKSAIESGIPHDTSELTNGAGFLTISDLPVYNGGVS